ncbi:Signal transduction histidine kinase [Marinobacter daqiaonensis]|uniref:histidine kinase n=1 Tax=Marinobacter daqiaonensis TaxID=650891 RepID=A0A1I6HB47_9GAMM|nr:response regulator [Marinobacter daqiaonensis]SFR51638.1 Signal transduction histidine kinase [Marinobacter daqiaonensis]
MSFSRPITAPTRRLGVRPLAVRLLLYVLLFSVLVAVSATAIQLSGETSRRLDEIRSQQLKAAEIVEDHLSQQLWLMNFAEVENILDDLRAFDVIQHAEIITPAGTQFSTGVYPEGDVISHERPLVVERPRTGAMPPVGRLVLTSSTEQVQAAVWDRAIAQLLLQSVIVMLGTLGLLFVIRLMLSRHLETMADYAVQLNLDTLTKPLRLNRKAPRWPDELSEVEHALNQMRQRLLEETRDLRHTSQQSSDERDEAIRANHAKNVFLANLSHELRIPLQSVLGYASLLHDTQLDQEQRDYVDTLLHAAEGLSAIINDLLDISSIEAGKLELDRIEFNLRDTLNDLVDMLGPRAREKGLALELRVDHNLPECLVGDPIRIRQVLLNLTSNAIRYTDSGHVLVGAELLGHKDGDARIRLSVEDTGIGISAANLPLIFEPYVQLDTRARRQLTGAGLGLTICRQLVRLMDGQLDVDSSPGEGSTFWVELALAEATQKTPRSRLNLGKVRGRRALVVDSYALSRKITLEMLSRLDMDIEAARSGTEALAALATAQESGTPFDAVILDGFVPDMDSDLLCQRIRNNPEWDRTRIFVLSANPQRGDGEHFREAGADAFLSKALRESRLAPILNQLFEDAEKGQRRFLTRFSLQAPVSPLPVTRPLPCGPMDVLLAEDNPVNRALTQRLLEKLGCHVTTAADGSQALALWRAQPFDLVFMDCVMPELDGYEATRQLRREEVTRRLDHTPVIALTASAMEQDEERSRKAGMDVFVAKPVNIDMLRAVLEQYCSESQPEI